MKQKILYTIEAILILMIIFTIPSYATTASVNTETLNLRKEASTSADIVELLSQNEELEVLSQDGDWYKVKHGNNTGYVKKEYIKVKEDSNSDTVKNTNTENTEPSANEEKTITTSSDIQNTKSTIKTQAKVRLIPSINANIVETIETNSAVEVISKTNKWAFIQYKEMTGWIPLENIETSIEENVQENTESGQTENTEENNESADTNNEEKVEETTNSNSNTTTYEKSVTKYVNTSSVYLRSKASTDSSIVTTLIKNTDVKVVGEEGDWYKITYNDLSGYIRKDLLSDSKTSNTTSRGGIDRTETVSTSEVEANTNDTTLGQQIVSYAKQYLNCPYVYGAAGSSSFDCSGFTMYVYKHFGYSLSHSATAQSKCGSYVAKENLQPGDLVFFLDYETMDGIGHCGIYIGDGNFIHASSGSGYCVKISTLTSGSYLKRYATARRLY